MAATSPEFIRPRLEKVYQLLLQAETAEDPEVFLPRVSPYSYILGLTPNGLEEIWHSSRRYHLAQRIGFALFVTQSPSPLYKEGISPLRLRHILTEETPTLSAIHLSAQVGGEPSAAVWKTYLTPKIKVYLSTLPPPPGEEGRRRRTTKPDDFIRHLESLDLSSIAKAEITVSILVQQTVLYYGFDTANWNSGTDTIVDTFFLQYLKKVGYLPGLFKGGRGYISPTQGRQVKVLFADYSPAKLRSIQLGSAFRYGTVAEVGPLLNEILAATNRQEQLSIVLQVILRSDRLDLFRLLLDTLSFEDMTDLLNERGDELTESMPPNFLPYAQAVLEHWEDSAGVVLTGIGATWKGSGKKGYPRPFPHVLVVTAQLPTLLLLDDLGTYWLDLPEVVIGTAVRLGYQDIQAVLAGEYSL